MLLGKSIIEDKTKPTLLIHLYQSNVKQLLSNKILYQKESHDEQQ